MVCKQKKDTSGTDAEREKIPSVLKDILTVALLYCAVAITMPWYLPVLITLWNVAGGKTLLWILFCIAALALLYVAVCYIRAVVKRMNFIRKLKSYCKANSVYISDIKKPFSSIFISNPGYDFRIEKNGTKYDCKFAAGVFTGSPIVFSDKGDGLVQHTFRLFRVEIFQIMTKFDFAYESEGKRILIVSPVPRKIFTSTNGSPPRIADVGEVVGKYTIYNSVGFLAALDRNCL